MNLSQKEKLIADWQAFYKNIFGKEYDFSNVIIPEMPNGGRWRLLVTVYLTLEQLHARCRELFNCLPWTKDNLDEKVTWNERDAKNGIYAIWVKDEVEADENLKYISANDMKVNGITTETFTERLIHEIKFCVEAGRHPDVDTLTLCAGSRLGDSRVPVVGWDSFNGKLDIGSYSADCSLGGLRARQVVP